MSLSEGEPRGSEQQQYWSDDAFRATLREEPPSAKLIAKTLAGASQLTQGAIVEETLLPRRTVSYALKRLEEAGLVASRCHVSDPRKRMYELTYEPDT